MRLEISVDNYRHQIDSTNPELLGQWVVEIFDRITKNGWHQATYVTVQAYPTFVYDEYGNSVHDWIADSRVIGAINVIHSPQELVDALQAQITEMEAIKNNG